jgi:hypothetical protein
VIFGRGLDVFGGQVKSVEPAPFVKPYGNDPTHGKQQDDAVPESAKVPIEFRHESPEDSSELETSRQQTKGFNPSNCKGHDNGYERNREVVVKLSNWLHESPAIRSQHKDVVGGIN